MTTLETKLSSGNYNTCSVEGGPYCPLVSVIVTCYNVESYVPATIESWLRQSHKNIEIVIVEDCSTDNTLKVLERLADTDSRIKLVRHSTNSGALAARISGLTAASGDFFIFCDGDDWVSPELVSSCLRDIPGVDCVMFQYENWDMRTGQFTRYAPRGGTAKKIEKGEPLSALDLSRLSHITPICFYRASFKPHYLKVFEGFHAPQFFEDIPSFLATLSSCSLKVVPRVMYVYRINRPGQSIEDWWRTRRALKYQGLLAAIEQTLRQGYLNNSFVKEAAYLKLLDIGYGETIGLASANPDDIVNLRRALHPLLSMTRTLSGVAAPDLRTTLFSIFIYGPGRLPGVSRFLKILKQIKRRLK